MPGIVRDSTLTKESEYVGSGVWNDPTTSASITTAGAVTYTAAQILSGIVKRDPNGASRTDVLPTAALIVAAMAAKMGSAKVGDMFDFLVINEADAAETITHTLGAGMTSGVVAGTQVSAAIAQNATRRYVVRLTNVTGGAEACVIYA
jgi:hypothetical protein